MPSPVVKKASIKASMAKQKALGDRGKWAEGQVRDVLTKIAESNSKFGFERLPDARVAMGRIQAQTGDFASFSTTGHGVLEVKETKHDNLLALAKVPQIAKLRKRVLCGGKCYLVVHHSTISKWRVVNINDLEHIERGSWDLSRFPLYNKLPEVLTIKFFLGENNE